MTEEDTLLYNDVPQKQSRLFYSPALRAIVEKFAQSLAERLTEALGRPVKPNEAINIAAAIHAKPHVEALQASHIVSTDIQQLGKLNQRRKRDSDGYVYFIKTQNRVKIGYSLNPFTREREIQTGSSEPVFLVALIEGTLQTEKSLHKRFAQHRLQGEWLSCVPEIEDYIKTLPPLKPRARQSKIPKFMIAEMDILMGKGSSMDEAAGLVAAKYGFPSDSLRTAFRLHINVSTNK